jgi:carbonic anhydrase
VPAFYISLAIRDGHDDRPAERTRYEALSKEGHRPPTTIVVLGHAQCGGVKAMVEGAPAATDFVNAWMQITEPALQVRAESSPRGSLDLYEHGVVRLSLGNLMTFPWIQTAVAGRRIQLHGYRFDIRNGTLAILKGNRFVNVGV